MSLPAHRRALAGRTWSRAYRPTDYAPIERPAPSRIADVVTAVVLGVIAAALLVHALAS